MDVAASGQSSNALRMQSVDGARAVACLLVLVYHSFQFANISGADLPWGIRQVVLYGNSGVDVFVVLSGFCLFLPICRAPSRFRTSSFYARRIRRIVPAYYASIVYVIALPYVLKVGYRILHFHPNPTSFPAAEQLLTHVFFLQTFSSKTWDGINGSYWSLGLEAQFYVVLPLIALGYRRFGVRAVVVATGVGLATQLVLLALWGNDPNFIVPHFLWSASVLGRLMEFGGGMLAAWFITSKSSWISAADRVAIVFRTVVRIAPVLALGYLLSLGSWTVPGIVGVAVWSVTIGLTLVGCATPGVWYAQVLAWPALSFLGLLSYSFYLVHQPTVYYVSQLADRLGIHHYANWAVQLTVGFAVVLALALVGYRYFERPFLGSRPTGAEARLADRVYGGFRRGRPGPVL